MRQLFSYFKSKGKVVTVINEAPRHEDILGSGSIASRILWLRN